MIKDFDEISALLMVPSEKVRAIRLAYEEGQVNLEILAEQYNVNGPDTVRDIVFHKGMYADDLCDKEARNIEQVLVPSEKVRAIRLAYEEGQVNLGLLAEHFDVDGPDTVRDIVFHKGMYADDFCDKGTLAVEQDIKCANFRNRHLHARLQERYGLFLDFDAFTKIRDDIDNARTPVVRKMPGTVIYAVNMPGHPHETVFMVEGDLGTLKTVYKRNSYILCDGKWLKKPFHRKQKPSASCICKL